MLSYHLYTYNIEDSAQPNNKLNNVTKQSFTNTFKSRVVTLVDYICGIYVYNTNQVYHTTATIDMAIILKVFVIHQILKITINNDIQYSQ